MANDLNQCNFIGRLGRDPEIQYMPSGDVVVSFSIAVGSSWKDKASGEKKEKTEWVNMTAFGKLAEVIDQYLKKGSKVFVTGEFTTRMYEKDGVKHYPSSIRVNSLQMLDSKPQSDTGAPVSEQARGQGHNSPRPPGGHPPPQSRPQSNLSDMDDDIPF